MRLTIIVAKDLDNVIGYNNTMPWNLPSDLKHFAKTTKGCPIVMGRKTWESLPKELPGRKHIVITRNPSKVIAPKNGVVLNSVEHTLDYISRFHNSDRVYIIGGSTIYEQFLSHVSEMIITTVICDICSDKHIPSKQVVRFPKEYKEQFDKELLHVERSEENEYPFYIAKYKRK